VLFSPLLQQPIDQNYSTFLLLFSLISLILVLISIIVLWTIFEKAGKPGWAAIIPIYNIIVFLDMVGRPWWWLLLTIVPGVNFIIGLILMFDLARVFGKGAGFAIGLILLQPLFLLILAFDNSEYVGMQGPPVSPLIEG
jgi:hypothetical protein